MCIGFGCCIYFEEIGPLIKTNLTVAAGINPTNNAPQILLSQHKPILYKELFNTRRIHDAAVLQRNDIKSLPYAKLILNFKFLDDLPQRSV